MEAPRKDLVLGCGTNYTKEQIWPFLESLRGSGFAGDVTLVIFPWQQANLQLLKEKFSIKLFTVNEQPSWLPSALGARLQNRKRMRYLHIFLARCLPHCCQSLSVLHLVSRHLAYFYHVSCGRYFLYYTILRQNRASRVLLTDVRDVVFQSNPFRYAGTTGFYAFLDPVVRLGDEPLNVRWITNLFGDRYCARHVGQKLYCSGTILADYAAMLNFLQKMCLVLIGALPQAVGSIGDDQAAFNYLLWENLIQQPVTCENGKNAVMTLKNAPSDSLRFNRDGELLNHDGTPAPVLHQYDFHPNLRARYIR